MNDYKQRVDKYVGVVLQAIECEQSIQLIMDSSLAYDVSKELYYIDKSKFEDYTEDMFDELLAENDILSVCVVNSSDGSVRLFLQEVFDMKGNTLPDEDSDFILIEENLLDCIDTSVYECVVGVICESDKTDEEIVDNEEDELENLFEELVDDIMQDILDNEDNSEFCLHCCVKDVIQEAYQIGYRDCIIENGIIEE